MIKLAFKDHIIPGQPNILVDFEASEEIKSKIHLVDKEFEMMVWKTLTNLDIVRKYELNEDKFEKFQLAYFTKDYNLVKKSFDTIAPKTQNVLLIWASIFDAVITDLETFNSNWKEFFAPSRDDLLIISEDLSWIAYIAHFECLFFGQGLHK